VAVQHPSAHLLLDCGEILWPQRGYLGELDLLVRPGNKHLLDHAAVKVDTGSAGARDQGRLTASGRHAAGISSPGWPWVFRLIVTGRFGVVTGRFGNVTDDSGGT
jgi:hypothetical protein